MSYLTEAEKDFNAILGEEIDMDSFFYISGHIFYKFILFHKKAFTWAIMVLNLLPTSKPLFSLEVGVFSELPLNIRYQKVLA